VSEASIRFNWRANRKKEGDKDKRTSKWKVLIETEEQTDTENGERETERNEEKEETEIAQLHFVQELYKGKCV